MTALAWINVLALVLALVASCMLGWTMARDSRRKQDRRTQDNE